MVVSIWISNILDLPFHIFNAPKTQVNWINLVFETTLIVAFASFFIKTSAKKMKNLHQFNGTKTICSYCNGIKNEAGTWTPVADFFRRPTMLEFSHGICPKCLTKIYDTIETFDPKLH